jgi:DNA-binding PadR family transcriptional regulator
VPDPIEREFLLNLWKIHILHHAGEEKGIYGQWMLEELREHGYRLSPGTLYPLLSRMHARGWLKAAKAAPHKAARVYRLTENGKKILARLRTSVGELHREVVAPYHPVRKAAVRRPGPRKPR